MQPSINEMIERGRKQLFDFNYPIFDEDYRKQFETHFIRNFYMREIGFETMGLFKFHLETWLQINMPYFNEMFKSELFEYDPLTNSKMDVSHTLIKDGSETNLSGKTQADTTNQTTEANGSSSENGSSTDSSKNDETSKVTDSGRNNQTSTTSGKSDGTTNSIVDETSDSTGTNTENGSRKNDDFNRSLSSDTPDSRLEITSNDGKGVIGYASEIKENKVNDNETTTKEGTNSTNKSGNKKTTGTTTDTTTGNQTVDGTNSSLTDTISNGTSSNTHNHQLDGSNEQNVLQNGSLNSKIDSNYKTDTNNVEDYVQHRIGKIGVQTYPKLITEYRNALLRLEKQIFNEMNELFMLIY